MTALLMVASAAVAQPPPELPNFVAEPNVRRIYVPVTELNALLKEDRQGVLLPQAEFRRLYDAARKAQTNALNEPEAVVVAAVDVSGRVDGETLRLSADVQFMQFEDAWQVIPLPISGLNVISAVMDDQPAPISRDGDEQNRLMVFSQARGAHRLRLELSAPLKSVGSDWLAEFQTLGAPSGTLRMTVAEGKSLLVDGLKYERSDPDDATSDIQVPLGRRSQLTLRITDSDLQNVADALVFAHSAYGVHVAPGAVTWSTQTAVQAYGQSLDQLIFVVPADLEVASVESKGLEEWVLADLNRGREVQITLTYRQPFVGERDVTIRGVLVPDEDQWTLPNLVLSNADSHVAAIVVQHGPEVRVQAEHDDDVRPVAGNKEPHSLQFRTMNPEFELDFRTLGKNRSVHVAMTNLLDISDDGLDLQTVADVETYFVPLFDVRVTLPADFEVTAASVEGVPVDWTLGTGVAGVIEVRIPLASPLNPGDARRVSLAAHADPEDWPLQRDPALLSFPEVGLPQADMIEARYGIMADDDLKIRTVELMGLDPAQQADLIGLKQGASAAGRDLRLGFNYQDTVFSGQLEVSRTSTRLAVSTWSLSRLDPQTVQSDLQLFVTVDGGGTEGLLLQLPESTGTDLRFAVEPADGNSPQQRVSIVEQTAAEPIDGQRSWALRFDRRMRGDHVIRVSLVEPRPEEGPVTLPFVSLTGAERQNGWIAVEARQDQRLGVQATDAGGLPLPAVDPIDLPGMQSDAGQRRIVAGVRYVQPGYQVLVAEQTLEAAPVPTALADRVEGASVLGGTGLLLHRLDVAFRAVGMQSLLVSLPERSDVWAVLIDGVPVEVRQTDGGYRVPLAASRNPSASRTLRLIYRSHGSKPRAIGHWKQSTPQLACVTGAGKLEPLPVLQQQWTLHYPRDVVLLDSQGLFTPTTELIGDGWLSGLRDAITLPTLNEFSRRLSLVAAMVLVCWVIALIWRRFGNWSLAILGIGIPIAFGAMLFYSFSRQEFASSTYFSGPESTALSADAAGAQEYGGFAGEDADASTIGVAFGGGGGIGGGGAVSRDGTNAQLEAFDAPNRPAARPADSRAGTDLSLQIRQPQETPPAEMTGGEPDASPASEPQIAGEPSQAAQPAAPDGIILGFELNVPDDEALPAIQSPIAARGALLSLSLDLEPPVEHRSATFRTLAPDSSDDGPALDVTYGTRSSREAIAIIIAAGLALIMWSLRRIDWPSKLIFVLATIVIPVAVVPIVPAAMTMIAEGMLLGGLAGLFLWGVRSLVPLVARCCRPSWWTSAEAMQKSATGGMVAVTLFLASGVSQAQSTDSETKVVPPPVVAANQPPTIVVPYDGDDPSTAERVYLPQKLFRELWRKAHPDQQPRPAAPVEGLVTEALYAVSITSDERTDEQPDTTLRVHGRFVVFGFRDHPVWIPLPLDQVAVGSATLDDVPAVLQPNKEARLELLVLGEGMHVLDLMFDVTAEVRSQSGQFELPLRPVASGALAVTLPPTDQEQSIRITAAGRPAVVSDTVTDDEGRQRITAMIDESGPIRVSWQPLTSRADRDNLVQVESRTAVEIADGGIEMTAEFLLQVRQGLLAEVPFSIPELVRLKRITGPDVGGWQIEGTGQERTLTIFLRRSIGDNTSITAELFLPQEDRDEAFRLSIPEFAPLAVTRETGQLAVLADSHLDVRSEQTAGLRQLDRDTVLLPSSLPPTTDRDSSSVQLAYRFASRPWQLDLAVRTSPPQTTADCEHGVYLGYRKVLYRSRMTIDLTGAPSQTLRISLTDDFLLTDVVGEAVEDWFLEDIELVVDLGQPRVGRVELMLEGHVVRDEGDEAAVVITPLPLDLDRQQSVLAVWVDPVFSATLDSFETWRTIDRAELPLALRTLHGDEPQFAFRSPEVVPEIVGFDLIRRQPQVSSNAVTVIALSDVSVDYGMTLRWTIERAATDLLAFTTPGWLQDRLEISDDDIRQTTQEVTEDGRVRWTVQLADPVRGQFLLTAVATLPPPADGQIAAPDIRFEQPPITAGGEFTELESQQAFAMLVNLSRGRLSPVGDLDPLLVRREQLPLVLHNDLIAQAMAIIRVPAESEVSWTLQSVTEQHVQAAQVTGAELTSVLSVDGTLRTVATYRVRNRGQQFLALKLPPDSRILSILVKGEPARCLSAVVGEQPVSLVPLPQTSLADLSFLVRVVVQDRITDDGRLAEAPLGADYAIPVPTIVSPNESREFGVPVVSTSWTVYVPQLFDASSVDDPSRTNVSFQPPEEAQGFLQQQLFRELSDLGRLAKSEQASYAQRQMAIYNIKQIGLATQIDMELHGGSPSSLQVPNRRDSELAKQNEALWEESLRVADEVGQQLDQAESVTVTDDSFSMNSAGRSFVAENNFQILQGNRGEGATVSEEGAREFRFDRSEQDTKLLAGMPDMLAGKAAASRSKLRGRLESQVPTLGTPIATAPANKQSLSGQVPASRFGGVQAGGGGADFDSLADLIREPLPNVPDQWLQRGGLSLPIELPAEGRALTFSKLGGDPRLTLSIRPRETGEWSIRWLWAFVILAAGAWLLHQAAHQTAWKDCCRGLCLVLVAVGAMAVLCLPLPLNILGGVLLIVGSLVGLLQWQPGSQA